MNAHLQADFKMHPMIERTTSPANGSSHLLRVMSAWPAPAVFVLMLALVLLVGWIDYATGLQLSVSLLYLIPIVLATRLSGRGMGYAMAVASAVVWFAADWMERQSYGHWHLPAWNTLTLAISFLVVVALLASLREANEGLEQKVAQRTKALQDEVAQRRRAEDKARPALREVREAHVELQRTQFQFIESAKMESVARLAAGVAHDVKNPLMTLSLGADYCLNRKSDSAEETQLAQDMKEAVLRASSVINILLDYSRPCPLQLTSEGLHAVIENSLTLVRHQCNKHRVAVVRDFAPDLPPVQLDRTRIEHVFVNLFLDAPLHAMPPGGTLTVPHSSPASPTAIRLAKSQWKRTTPVTAFGRKTQSNSLSPSFTTRPPGQGTGLGLAIVRRIMEVHGGAVQLTNQPGGGGARATLQFNPQTKVK